MTERAAYIKKVFSLEELESGEWKASWSSFGLEFVGTREHVCSFARSYWGHFNFQDEAEAFAEIFS